MVEHSLNVFERLGQHFWQAYAYRWLGEILMSLNEMSESQFFSSSYLDLARKSGERQILADALLCEAYWHYMHTRIKEAIQDVEQAYALHEQLSQVMNVSIYQFAKLTWLAGDHQRAKSLLLEQQQRLGLLGEKYMRSNQLASLGRIALEEGELDQARTWLNEAMELKKEMEDRYGEAFCLADLSILAYLQGNPGQFKQILKECFALVRGMTQYRKTHILTILISCPYFQQPENSIPFLGVIAFQHQQFESPIDPLRKRYCDSAEIVARAAMGDAAFESACAEAATLSLDEALDRMLKKVEEL